MVDPRRSLPSVIAALVVAGGFVLLDGRRATSDMDAAPGRPARADACADAEYAPHAPARIAERGSIGRSIAARNAHS